MIKHLNIVSFDVPYPPNYGGAIDVFYKLKALSELGVKIVLHTFEYGRGEQKELEKYCVEVVYYKRKKTIFHLMSQHPFIVVSRNSKELLKNLLLNDFPIFFEGLHTTSLLNSPELKERNKIVRTHNIEHDYYNGMAFTDERFLKRLFFKNESIKLKKYEPTLEYANTICAISKNDTAYFNQFCENVVLINAFHPNNAVNTKEGIGDYILYHGNLSVTENVMAVNYLLENVFPRIAAQVIIAGKNPDYHLEHKVSLLNNVKLVANPSQVEMDEYIANAQVNVLPTFQSTGIKLKLIESLFSGRHCVVNTVMVENTGIESLCELANTAEEFVNQINRLMLLPITSIEIENRKKTLLSVFSNIENAKKITELI